jgi:hypothetical protein
VKGERRKEGKNGRLGDTLFWHVVRFRGSLSGINFLFSSLKSLGLVSVLSSLRSQFSI